MSEFILDPRLQKDCIVLGKTSNAYVLLMNNALVPWFILVPMVEELEFFELSCDLQKCLMEEVNAIVRIVKGLTGVERINMGMIGNIVSQCHIHIVGRSKTDFCWPRVVWGETENQEYTTVEIEVLLTKISDDLNIPFEPLLRMK